MRSHLPGSVAQRSRNSAIAAAAWSPASRVDVEAGPAVLDDLRRATVARREGRQAGRHRLDDREAERFEQRGLDENAPPVRDPAVELAREVPFEAHAEPPDRVAEAVLVEEGVHPLDLGPLLVVGRRGRIEAAADDEEVRDPPQRLRTRVPLHEPGEVLDAVEPRHREDDRLALLREAARGRTAADRRRGRAPRSGASGS